MTLSESAPRSGLEAHRLLLASRVSIYLISHVNHKRNSLPIQLWGPNLVYMVADFPNSIGEIERALFSWMKRHILGVGYWEHSSIQFYSLTPCDHAILWGQEFSIRIRCHLPSALSAAAAVVIKTPWLKNSDERSESYRSSSHCNMRNSLFFTLPTPQIFHYRFWADQVREAVNFMATSLMSPGSLFLTSFKTEVLQLLLLLSD